MKEEDEHFFNCETATPNNFDSTGHKINKGYKKRKVLSSEPIVRLPSSINLQDYSNIGYLDGTTNKASSFDLIPNCGSSIITPQYFTSNIPIGQDMKSFTGN